MPHLTRTQQRTLRRKFRDNVPLMREGKGQYPKRRPAMDNTGARVLTREQIAARNELRATVEGRFLSKLTERMVAVRW